MLRPSPSRRFYILNTFRNFFEYSVQESHTGIPESRWIIEGQAFSPSYDLAPIPPRHPPPPPSSVSLMGEDLDIDNLLKGEGGWRGRGRSKIIRRREKASSFCIHWLHRARLGSASVRFGYRIHLSYWTKFTTTVYWWILAQGSRGCCRSSTGSTSWRSCSACAWTGPTSSTTSRPSSPSGT